MPITKHASRLVYRNDPKIKLTATSIKVSQAIRLKFYHKWVTHKKTAVGTCHSFIVYMYITINFIHRNMLDGHMNEKIF